MLRIVAWLGQKARAFLSLFLPVYQKARGPGGMPHWLGIVLHVLIVVALLAGLFWINSKWFHWNIAAAPWLRANWLPILGLLIYVLCWLSYWLWKLLVSGEEGPYFADIEAAWGEAKAALREAGIGLTDQPLFLVLGQPEDDEKALFQAAQLTLEVEQAPAGPDAPLHIYATREAMYLTCAGASLLGCHARFLAGKLKLGDRAVSGREESAVEEDASITATISPGARGGRIPNKGGLAHVAQEMAEMLQRAGREGREVTELTKSEKRRLRAIYRKGNPKRYPLKDANLIAYEAARLQYLCQLLVRDRRPFCAINGVLLLIPYAACDSDQDATYTAEALQRDLAVTSTYLKVDCPLLALVCDMETANGFEEFLEHFKPSERLQRLGQRCPLNPDLRDEATESPAKDAVPQMLDSMAKWFCQSFMPIWVYRHFQIEKADGTDRAEQVRRNGQLFLLGDELQERSPRLGTILSRGLAQKAAAGPLLFGGCYLGATGSDRQREQAFVRGLLDRLDSGQSCVYWNQTTLEEEASYALWTNIGWTLIAILIGGVALFAAFRYFSGPH